MLLYKKFIHLQLILVVKNKKMFSYDFYSILKKNKLIYFLYYVQVVYSSFSSTVCQIKVLAKIQSKTILNFFLFSLFLILVLRYFYFLSLKGPDPKFLLIL